MNSEKKFDKNAPRFLGSHIVFDRGTGGITGTCPCGEFMEVYKVDKTFRVYTPESLDPEVIDPNMRSVVTDTADIGTGNEIVARILIQTREFLDSNLLPSTIDKEAIICCFHECKELLIECDVIAKKVSTEVHEIISKIDSNKLSVDSGGRALNPFPQVKELEDNSSKFLVNTKRFIQKLAEVFNVFYHTDFQGPWFNKIKSWARENLGVDSPVYKTVAMCEPNFKHIVDMRNFHEHPVKNKKTVIENFRLLPHSKVQPPVWYITGEPKTSIAKDMINYVSSFLESAEILFIRCMLDNIKECPFCVVEIPENEREKDCPVKYKWSIHQRSLK